MHVARCPRAKRGDNVNGPKVERYIETTPNQDPVEATVPGLRNAILRLRQAFPSLSTEAIRVVLGLPGTDPFRITPAIDESQHEVDK